MKKFTITILILTAALSALAQTKTVTNQDLEKFRQQRLAAERDMKEKYAEMGTTPEEVENRNRSRRAAMEQYSDQLLIQRIMAENLRLEQENARREYDLGSDQQPGFVYYYGGVPYFTYFPYDYKWRRPIRPNLRNLPPNMRTAQEYALGFSNTRSIFSTGNRSFRPRGRVFNPGPRPGINIRIGSGGRRF